MSIGIRKIVMNTSYSCNYDSHFLQIIRHTQNVSRTSLKSLFYASKQPCVTLGRRIRALGFSIQAIAIAALLDLPNCHLLLTLAWLHPPARKPKSRIGPPKFLFISPFEYLSAYLPFLDGIERSWRVVCHVSPPGESLRVLLSKGYRGQMSCTRHTLAGKPLCLDVTALEV